MFQAKIKPMLKRWRNSVYVLADSLYDSLRFIRHSHLGGRIRSATEYHGVITMEYHRLEKGLTLRDSRAWFGTPVVGKVLRMAGVDAYANERARSHAVESVHSYFRAHDVRGAVPPEPHGATLGRYRDDAIALLDPEQDAPWEKAGAKAVSADQIRSAGQAMDFRRFMESRHSTRDFADRPVDEADLLYAVELALRSPSVCNRQSWQCHFSTDPEVMARALECQNGNAGFRGQIPMVCIVTAKLGYFVSSGERYQAWVDGGMFAMSLILALHSKGLGSCCLNWSVDWWTDRKLRKAVRLPDDENVIMMLAVGHLPDDYSVCVSPRRPAADVLRRLQL